jgi:ribosome biogenesis GTPase A
LDSPGIIPREELGSGLTNLTKRAKINVLTYDRVKDPETVLLSLISDNLGPFEKYYEIEEKDPDLFLEKVGKKKNFLKKGGEVDTFRAARFILKDFQEDRIMNSELT